MDSQEEVPTMDGNSTTMTLKGKDGETIHRPLPREYYFDRDLHEREKRQIFAKTWRYVCHQSELRNAGDYMTITVADQNLFVLRGRDGQVRAFYNVCQHRAAELLQGRGTVKGFITCPYHSWSYDHGGCLRSAVNADNVPGFEKEHFGLSTVRCEVWCGFVFVNLDQEAESLKTMASDLEALIRKLCPEVETLKLADRTDWAVKCNWKTVVDNFIESYHLALSGPAHKAFTDLVDCRHFAVTPHSGGKYDYLWSSHIAPAGPKQNSAYPYDNERKMGGTNEFVSVHLFPDIGFVFFPGADSLVVFTLPPDGPEGTAEMMAYFTKDGSVDEDTKKGVHFFSYVLGPEDNDLVERVQRGLRSPGYRGGILMVDREKTGLSEHAVAGFHRQVMAAVG
jgi:phenylpropionate dioxygenase-like ring-hydroxylating dioxygenase large terminal subunit